MRAVVFDAVRRVRVERVPDPAIVDPGDAIVRVELTAICGSDLHVWHGRERGLDRGTVMGHEFVGEVVEVGADVPDALCGARVLSPFTTSCGDCPPCREGLTARCERGALFGWVERGRGLHGAQAELVRVPLAASTLVPLPDGVDELGGLLLGDVLSTGAYCVELAGLGPGPEPAVVLGCGPVGLMAVVAAREAGVERVLAVDAVPERLALARRYGAEPVELGAETAARLREACGGRGAAAVLELVGSPDAARLAFDSLRPGGTIATVGVHTAPDFPFSPVEAYDRNLTYRIGRCPARRVLERMIPVVRSGRHDLAAVVSHRLPIDRAPEGYELFDAKRDGCTKVVLQP